MRRISALLVVIPVLACGSATSNSTPSTRATILQTQTGTDGSGNYFRQMVFGVTDVAGAPVPNGVVLAQADGGTIAPQPLATAANGQGTLTWTIPAASATPGHTFSLGFCAVPSGAQNCQSSLGAPDAVHVSF